MDRIRQLINAKKPCHTAHRIGVIAFEEGLKCWLIIQDSKKIHFGDRNSCVQGTKCTQSLMLYEILFPLLSATIYVRSAKAPKRRKKKGGEKRWDQIQEYILKAATLLKGFSATVNWSKEQPFYCFSNANTVQIEAESWIFMWWNYGTLIMSIFGWRDARAKF